MCLKTVIPSRLRPLNYSKSMVSDGVSVLSKIANKLNRMSIINTSPRAAHTSDTGFGGNEAHRSVEAFHDAKNIDARGAQFNHVGHDQINYHGTTGTIQTPNLDE
jgi:hypothetical protein